MMLTITFLALAALLGPTLASPVAATVAVPPSSDESLLRYLTETNPETIVFNPVPGMPTLEELNITVADFFKPEFRAKHGLPDPRNKSPAAAPHSQAQPRDLFNLEKRDGLCYQNIADVTHINAAYACRDYLNSLGTRACVAGGGWTTYTVMCDLTASDTRCVTKGSPAYAIAGSVSSYCSDVARGMQWVIDNCRTNNPCGCGVGGVNAAWGNGNLIVSVFNH